MDKISISKEEARNIVSEIQLFKPLRNNRSGVEGVEDVAQKLGYVQIDSINVINRAHHHTLWTRLPDYDLPDVYQAQKEKCIFEYWGHAMSFLPMKDYRFYLPYKEQFNDPYSKWEKDRLEKFGHLMQPALERIRADGPMSTKDFVSEDERKGGTWWDWRPIKVALELLFWQGKLMVVERKKFQKIFDLTERVLPDEVDTTKPSDEELGVFLVQRVLQSYGLANTKEIIDHLRVARKKVIVEGLKQLLTDGKVLEVEVQSVEQKHQYYMLAENANSREQVIPDDVFIFSPFDNFCIQRDRMKVFFDFEYALECYLKKEKRQFGYFTLPIFWRDQFVAKMDAKAVRKEKLLRINNFAFEPTFKPDDGFLTRFRQKLLDFAQFQKCESVVFEKISPKQYTEVVSKLF